MEDGEEGSAVAPRVREVSHCNARVALEVPVYPEHERLLGRDVFAEAVHFYIGNLQRLVNNQNRVNATRCEQMHEC